MTDTISFSEWMNEGGSVFAGEDVASQTASTTVNTKAASGTNTKTTTPQVHNKDIGIVDTGLPSVTRWDMIDKPTIHEPFTHEVEGEAKIADENIDIFTPQIKLTDVFSTNMDPHISSRASITESTSPAVLEPTIGMGEEGSRHYMKVHDATDVDAWIKKYKSKLINISNSEINKIQSRLSSATPKNMGPYSITFTGHNNELHIVDELGKPGMTRSATLLNPVTGKVKTIKDIRELDNPPSLTLLGITDVVNLKMGKIGRVRLEVAAIAFEDPKNGRGSNRANVVSRSFDLQAYDTISIDALKTLYNNRGKSD